jgi:SAM-dependent methyltransferase
LPPEFAVSAAESRALSFGGIAAEYDRLRPSPAPAALDWLLPDPCRLAIDLAAGTGLFTRSLAQRVGEVIAIEPDPRMREIFSQRTPGIPIRDGRGESIPLPDASADLVTISSAWHWMDPSLAAPEIGRVLRDGGRLAIIWTHMTHDARLPSPDWAALGVQQTVDRGRLREVHLPPDAPFTSVEYEDFSHSQLSTKADIVATLATYSPVIALAEDVRRRALGEAAQQLEERFPGQDPVEVTITSGCVRADRLPR